MTDAVRPSTRESPTRTRVADLRKAAEDFQQSEPPLLAAAQVRRLRQHRHAESFAPKAFVPDRPPSPAVIELPPHLADIEEQVMRASGAATGDDNGRSRMEYVQFRKWQQERQKANQAAVAQQQDELDDPARGADRRRKGNTSTSGGAGDRRKFELVPPGEQWMPGLNTLFMEKVFSRDLWHHVGASGSRVDFCRCGGSYKDDAFKELTHDPSFMHLAGGANSGSTINKRASERRGGESPPSGGDAQRGSTNAAEHPAGGFGASLLSRSRGKRSGNADRETLLFRLTDAPAAQLGSQPSAYYIPPVPNTEDDDGQSGDEGGSAKRSPMKRRPDLEVIPVVQQVSLLDIRGEGASSPPLPPPPAATTRGAGGPAPAAAAAAVVATPANRRMRPRLTADQKAVARAIGAPNREFRRMVEYRKQKVKQRAEAARLQHRATRRPDVHEQRPLFERLLQDQGKSLYQNGAEEVERWTEDRERNFETKYQTVDVSHTTPTWQRAIEVIRSTVAAKLETEFSQERLELQALFSARLCEGIEARFPKRSAEGLRLLREIQSALSTGCPFGARQVQALVESIPPDAYFLDDVTSIVYSLAVSLDIPDVHWVSVIREKTKFLSLNKELVAPDADVDSARWVLRIRPSELGPNAFAFALTAPACFSLTPAERASLANGYPRERLAACADGVRDPAKVCDELRQAILKLAASGRVRPGCVVGEGGAVGGSAAAKETKSKACDQNSSSTVTVSPEVHERFVALAAQLAKSSAAVPEPPVAASAAMPATTMADRVPPTTSDLPRLNLPNATPAAAAAHHAKQTPSSARPGVGAPGVSRRLPMSDGATLTPRVPATAAGAPTPAKRRH